MITSEPVIPPPSNSSQASVSEAFNDIWEVAFGVMTAPSSGGASYDAFPPTSIQIHKISQSGADWDFIFTNNIKIGGKIKIISRRDEAFAFVTITNVSYSASVLSLTVSSDLVEDGVLTDGDCYITFIPIQSGPLTVNLLEGDGAGGFTDSGIWPAQLKSSGLTYAAIVDLNLLAEGIQDIALTGDIEFTTSNLAFGLSKTVRIVCDGTNRNFIFPAWDFVGSGGAPANIIANKKGILTITSFGPTNADVIAAYAEMP